MRGDKWPHRSCGRCSLPSGQVLGLIGAWFSLRTMRLATGVVACILVITVTQYGLTHPANAARRPRRLVPARRRRGRRRAAAAAGRRRATRRERRRPVADRRRTFSLATGSLRPGPGASRHLSWTCRRSATASRPPERKTRLPRHGPNGRGRGRPQGDGRAASCPAGRRAAVPAARDGDTLPRAILPGGSRTSALASIAESSGVSGAGLVSALIRLASLFWPGPRRIRVRVWIEPPLAGTCAGSPFSLRTRGPARPISTKTVTGDNLEAAASMVAGYIARQVFAMDRTVAAWCYGAADGRDLGAMQLARMERVHAACHKDVLESKSDQIRILGKAMGKPVGRESCVTSWPSSARRASGYLAGAPPARAEPGAAAASLPRPVPAGHVAGDGRQPSALPAGYR